MKIFELNLESRLAAPLPEVFRFFGDPANLEWITPPWLRLKIVSIRPEPVTTGTLIDYRLKVHGLPLGWRSEITAWEPPYRFVDEQRKGPYRLWRHEHLLVESGDGTLVRDRVEYAIWGGRWVNWLVARDLKKIFEFRRSRLIQRFGEQAQGSRGSGQPLTAAAQPSGLSEMRVSS